MSHAVFLRPDENGNWGKIAIASTTGTEASVSASFADATSNTTPAMSVGSFMFGYNGTAWDRIKTAASDALGSTGVLAAGTTLFNGGNFVRQRTADSIFDGNAGGLIPATVSYGFAGITFDRVRVGKVYRYIEYLNLPTATSTTIWTPAAGRKFRLMGVIVTTSASVHLHLRDSTTVFHTVRCLATGQSFDFGNGYLSAAANNVLEIRNDSGTTTNVWVTAWGTEE